MLQTGSMGSRKMFSAGATKLWGGDPRDWIGQESSMCKEQSSALRRAIFKPQPQFDASAAISRHDSVNIRPAFCGHRISICTTLSQSPILEVLRCHHQLPTKPPLKLQSYERPCHSKPTSYLPHHQRQRCLPSTRQSTLPAYQSPVPSDASPRSPISPASLCNPDSKTCRSSNPQRAHHCNLGPQPRRTWDWLQPGRSWEALRVRRYRSSHGLVEGGATCEQMHELPLC